MSESANILEKPPHAAHPSSTEHERGLVSQVLRSGGLLTASRLASKLLALATMSVLAYQLSEIDMGIAMSLLAGVALVEMLGEIGFDQRLLQLDEDEAIRQLPSVQSVLLLRGLGATTILCLLAYPLGIAFGFGDHRLAFFTVAAVPLVRSVRNVQIVIRQRRLDFRAYALAELLPEVVAIAAVLPATRIFEGYHALVAITYLRAIAVIVVSHSLAETPYRLGWNRSAVRGLLLYGWPLMVNGLLIYGSIQGDRLIVASTFDMASMAAYSLASTYAFLPSLAVNSLLQRLFLPLLVGQQDSASFNQRYGVIRMVCCAAALSFFAIFLLCGPRGTSLLMSDKYAGIYPLIVIIALAAGVRTLRCSLVIPLLANGRTRVVLWGSLARCTGLLIAIVFAIWGKGLPWIAAAALNGELFAALISIVVIRRSSSIDQCTIWSELGPFAAFVTLLAATHHYIDRHLPFPFISTSVFLGIVSTLAWRSLAILKRAEHFKRNSPRSSGSDLDGL